MFGRLEVVEQNRDRFLNELLAERDAFVYRNEEIILSTIEEDGTVTIVRRRPTQSVPPGQRGNILLQVLGRCKRRGNA